MKNLILITTLLTSVNALANCRLDGLKTDFVACASEVMKLSEAQESEICFLGSAHRATSVLSLIDDDLFDEVEIGDFKVAQDRNAISFYYSPYTGETTRVQIKRCNSENAQF